ncbi:MAG: hypothetical protein ACI8Q9_001270 [Planctomycetota bacterium]
MLNALTFLEEILVQGPSKGQQYSGQRRGRWAQAEVDRLKELYGVRDEAAIARELGRSVVSVRKMAESICRGEPRQGPWAAVEVQELKRFLGVSTPEVIARLLGRPEDEVRARIQELGQVRTETHWGRDEIVEFKRVFGTRTNEDLTRIFGRPMADIESLAAEHALAKDKAFLRRLAGDVATRMPRWSSEELELLKELYPTNANLDIARELGRSVKSVVSKAHNMGLRKDLDRLREMGRQNVSHRYQREDDVIPSVPPSRAMEELEPVEPPKVPGE